MFRVSGAIATKRPVYYADYYNLAGCPFFNTITEIRDDAGYEWAPDNDVEASIGRGVRQVRRALDSLALGSLFTHETDFIYKIEPDRWAEIIAGVAKGIASYNPHPANPGRCGSLPARCQNIPVEILPSGQRHGRDSGHPGRQDGRDHTCLCVP